ncbi:hypothetical protein AsAng_0015610 [Aureispira anguillae]|uniref:Uncharacterized protein n=1 Tax=Aureispira anguillae TaxID=2864201 RepID=A0A916DQR0_9BACT|nr:hypothetical protein AsAng_0015610 [Aureispira anguillae]
MQILITPIKTQIYLDGILAELKIGFARIPIRANPNHPN